MLAPFAEGVYAVAGLRSVAISGVVNVAALVGAHWLVLRRIEKREWTEVGLGRTAATPRTFGLGFIIGSAAIAVPALLLVMLGMLRFLPDASLSWTEAFFRLTVMLLPAALAEELLVRGYLFAVLRDAWGARWAVVATSLGFAALHVRNPDVSAIALIVVALAGVFLALVLLRFASLYAAWIAHFAWNWIMAAILHAPVSGTVFESPRYRLVDSGADWITGGAWGPEGGLAAAVGLIAAAGYLYARRNTTQE